MKVPAPITFEPEQLVALREFAKANPQFWYKEQPSVSAVVRHAVDLFLSADSANVKRETEQTQTA